MSKIEAEGFYAVHKERPFFGELTDFMSSGPCLVMALEAEGAIRKWRDLMGATNPAEAAEQGLYAVNSGPPSVIMPHTVLMHQRPLLLNWAIFLMVWNCFDFLSKSLYITRALR